MNRAPSKTVATSRCWARHGSAAAGDLHDGHGGWRVVLDEETRSPLVVEADGTLTASFQVEADGFYRIDLQAPDGDLVTASPQYTVDALTDQPPAVMFIDRGVTPPPAPSKRCSSRPEPTMISGSCRSS